MQTKSLLTAMLALPFLLGACDRMSPGAGSSAPSQDSKPLAAAPAEPDKTMDRAPPAAGNTAPAPSATDAAPANGSTSADAGKPPADAPKGS